MMFLAVQVPEEGPGEGPGELDCKAKRGWVTRNYQEFIMSLLVLQLYILGTTGIVIGIITGNVTGVCYWY